MTSTASLGHGYYLEDLSPDMEASVSKTITDEDVRAFAELSGDINPVHIDDDFAAGTIQWNLGGLAAGGSVALTVTADVLDNDAGDSSTLSVDSWDDTGTIGVVTGPGEFGGAFGYDPNGQFETLAVGTSTTDSWTYEPIDDSGPDDDGPLNPWSPLDRRRRAPQGRGTRPVPPVGGRPRCCR